MERKQYTLYTPKLLHAINISTLQTLLPSLLQPIAIVTYNPVTGAQAQLPATDVGDTDAQTLLHLYQYCADHNDHDNAPATHRVYGLCPPVSEVESGINALERVLPHLVPNICRVNELLIPIQVKDEYAPEGINNRWVLLRIVPSEKLCDNKAAIALYDSKRSGHPAHARLIRTARRHFMADPGHQDSAPSVVERLGQQVEANPTDGPWVNRNLRTLIQGDAPAYHDKLDINAQYFAYFTAIGDHQLAKQALAERPRPRSFWQRHQHTLQLSALIILPSALMGALIVMAPQLSVPILAATAAQAGLDASLIGLMPLYQVAALASILLALTLIATLGASLLIRSAAAQLFPSKDEAINTTRESTSSAPTARLSKGATATTGYFAKAAPQNRPHSAIKPTNPAQKKGHNEPEEVKLGAVPWQYALATVY